MTKIVFINRFFAPDESATSQMLTDLAMGLANRRRQVMVITSRQRLEDARADLPAQGTVGGVEVIRVWTTRYGRAHLPGRALDYLTFYLSSWWALLRILRRGDIVIPKTDPPMLSVPVQICSMLRGARQVNWLQDVYPEIAMRLGTTGPLRLVAGALLGIRNWSMAKASLNVTIGRQMHRHFLAEGISDTRLAVIPNWTDVSAIHPIEAHQNPLRAAWHLEGKFVLGYSGNLGRAHRFEAILDAARHYRRRSEVCFLFIGGGAGMTALRQAAERENLDNIVFKPYQPREQLAASLCAADVHLVSLDPAMEGLIVPSKYYGIAAAGRPVVYLGSTTGEVARHLHTSRSGVAIEPHDAPALIALIDQAISDRGSALHAMGQRARALAVAKFARDHAIDKWDDCLARVASLPSNSSSSS